MKAPTNQWLYARIATLEQRVADLEDELGINVPLPKRFEPR